MTMLFPSLISDLVPKLDMLLHNRSESVGVGVTIANRLIPIKDRRPGYENRHVVLLQGDGTGDIDNLDSTTIRVRVFARDECDAEDLATLVRFLLTTTVGVIDGNPIVAAKLNSGPVEVANSTDEFEWYMVVNVTRRGRDLR